jgi:nucleotide-binding universal stress UspA family protein
MMKLLVPVDGSDHALKAAKMAVGLMRESGGEVILLSVAHDITPLGVWEIGHRESILQDLQAKAQEAIDKAKEVLKLEGVEARASLVETGAPADEIIRVANEQAVDIIVMGSRGLTGLPHYLLGSVAHKVVTYALCPVLVVK